MNDERDTVDNGNPEDKGVSDAYRQLADERVPEHLNQRILKQATTATSAFAREIPRWMRPLAWVATITLSFAIVLEVTRTPELEPSLPASTMPALPDVEEEKREQEAFGKLEEAETPDPGLAGKASADAPAMLNANDQRSRVRDKNADNAAPSTIGESAATEAARITAPTSAPSSTVRREAANKPATEPVRQQAADESQADAFEVRDLDLMQQAEEQSRAQSGNSDSLEESTLRSSAIAADMIAEFCSESQTGDVEDWLECIDTLEKEGKTEAATAERKRLQEAFPDVDLP